MPRDYTAMTNQQLAALARQYHKSIGITCEYGHPDCGCSNVETMDGLAACFMMVSGELKRRAA